MKITAMTYNIVGGRDHHNLPAKFAPDAVTEVIRGISPDFCALNEVDFNLPRSGKCHLAEYIADKLGMYSYFGRAVTWGTGDYGNALISKYPIYSAETIPVHDPLNRDEDTYYETRCVIKAKVSLPERETTVIVTHFGLAKTEQMNSVATVLQVLSDTKGPVVLMGDFNVLPDHAFMKLFRSMLVCADDSAAPGLFTFPSRPEIDAGKPGRLIDYIFVSDDFKVESVFSPEEIASDHKPLVAILNY